MTRPTMTFFSIPTIVKGLAKKFVIGDGGPGEFCHALPRGHELRAGGRIGDDRPRCSVSPARFDLRKIIASKAASLARSSDVYLCHAVTEHPDARSSARRRRPPCLRTSVQREKMNEVDAEP
jgi:hypothetical protein